MNNTLIVGRLVNEPTISTTETGQKLAKITLAITRSYKNSEGLYDTDFIPCIIYNEMANSTKEYCRKGDLIGIRGRLESLPNKTIAVVADKVTFLATKKTEQENELGKGEI